jgi:hypothetical protein
MQSANQNKSVWWCLKEMSHKYSHHPCAAMSLDDCTKASAESLHMEEENQCKGITKAGIRCRRCAMHSFSYCFQHSTILLKKGELSEDEIQIL